MKATKVMTDSMMCTWKCAEMCQASTAFRHALQVGKRAARMGRNPATGAAIKIKASKKVIPNGMANYPVRLAGKG